VRTIFSHLGSKEVGNRISGDAALLCRLQRTTTFAGGAGRVVGGSRGACGHVRYSVAAVASVAAAAAAAFAFIAAVAAIRAASLSIATFFYVRCPPSAALASVRELPARHVVKFCENSELKPGVGSHKTY